MSELLTPRLSLPYPTSSLSPNGPAQLLALVLALDNLMGPYSQGILANRPTSTSGSPGIQGRVYFVIGDSTPANNGILWLDYGTGWSPLNAASPTYAELKVGPLNPTGVSTGGVYVMMGLGRTGASITPTATGKLAISLTGNLSNSGGVAAAYLATGTGTAPVNGAAATGTALTSAQESNAPGGGTPFTTFGLIDVTVGVPLWIDLALSAGAGIPVAANIDVWAFERP